MMAREAGIVGRWGYFLGGDGGVTVVMVVTMGAIVGSGVGEAMIVIVIMMMTVVGMVGEAVILIITLVVMVVAATDMCMTIKGTANNEDFTKFTSSLLLSCSSLIFRPDISFSGVTGFCLSGIDTSLELWNLTLDLSISLAVNSKS